MPAIASSAGDITVISDRPARSMSGYAVLVGGFVLLGLAAYLGWLSFGRTSAGGLLAIVIFLFCILVGKGLYILQPNYSAVMQLFGSYIGTDATTGLRWVNPLYTVTKVSRRVQTMESARIKVNDLNGNPIEIAAAVIWRVRDAAKAVLQVENYGSFVQIQSETSVRKLASSHPYDDTEAEVAEAGQQSKVSKPVSLLSGGEQVVAALVEELSARLAPAGIEVTEARITHLAYAPEIASAMLRRQQAQAIIAPRKKIVEGAVDMVKDALDRLQSKDIPVEEERRAALVSNLLVVLVSDKDAAPIVNAGSLSFMRRAEPDQGRTIRMVAPRAPTRR
jgi:regulator of protease activity HflC (stomatin/prohibitin superfamily)